MNTWLPPPAQMMPQVMFIPTEPNTPPSTSPSTPHTPRKPTISPYGDLSTIIPVELDFSPKIAPFIFGEQACVCNKKIERAQEKDYYDLVQRINALGHRADAIGQRVDSLSQKTDALSQKLEEYMHRLDSIARRIDSLEQRVAN